jgi:glucuronate isomerase
MTRRRDFIKRSALGSAALAASGMGFGCSTGDSQEENRYRIIIPGSGHISLRESQKKIFGALETVPVIDPHCHLDASQPAARNLADIILYHHVWIELISAGMGQNEVTKAGLPHELADPEMEPVQRVQRALPYLNRIRNTTVGSLLRWLLSDLYGINGPLRESDIDKLASSVERNSKDESWPEHFFSDICRIEKAVTVEPLKQNRFERIAGADERLRMLNIADGKATPSERLQSMAGILGRDIRTASDYRDFAAKLATDKSFGSPLFLGAWMPAFFTDEMAQENAVNRIIGKAREGESLSPAEMGSVSYFGMLTALEALRSTPIRTIQLIAGAEVIPPHRSLTQWSGRFCGACARLASHFGDFRFNLSTASDAFTQDIAVMSKHIPNVSVAGYWWHTLYPFYIRKSIETRMDLIPSSKIIAFFSDAYHIEWCLPKLKLVKQIFGEVLIDRVSRGMYDIDTALSIIPVIFYDAPKEIYGL